MWADVRRLAGSCRDRRVIERLIAGLRSHRVALLLGAGVDRALSKDGSTWSDLVSHLTNTPVWLDSTIQSTWNIEIAAAARLYHGDQGYFDEIEKSLGKTENPSPLWDALAALSRCVPLIVTTNYSDLVAKALRRGGPIDLVDRTDLCSASLPEPGSFPGKPLLVHIHGRGEQAILDSLGYEQVQYGDLLYQTFLAQLFERWSVLAIGYSFSDATFRVAAAVARMRRPVLRQEHVWIDRKMEDTSKWLSRAAFLSYSISRIEVEKYEEGAELAKAISEQSMLDLGAAQEAIRSGDYDTLATLLDDSGDYESSYQIRLFREADEVLQLVQKLISSSPPFLTLARLERHLRHHLYFAGQSPNIKSLRGLLWEKVLKRMNEDPISIDQLKSRPGLHFDFLLGSLEVAHRTEYGKLICLLGEPLCPKLNSRLKKAENVWPSPSTVLKAGEWSELRKWATDVGWESIEAKMAFQEAKATAEEAAASLSGPFKSRTVDKVLRTCQDSFNSARHAGTIRRMIGSVVLWSLWVPDIVEAKSVLKSAVSLAKKSEGVDPTLTVAIAWAWSRMNPEQGLGCLEEIGWAPGVSKAELDQQAEFWSPKTTYLW